MSGRVMNCRPGCGACCTAPSISSPLPGMPSGKPAGVRCVNLDDSNRCRVWETELYPEVCRRFRPELLVCGETNAEAFERISQLESLTRPANVLLTSLYSD
jgi:uncharacterized protein